MILFILFTFFLLLENLFLPALMGPGTLLISPLFLAGIIIYGKNTKIKLFQACLFLFLWEIYSGVRIGLFIIPFGITAGLYTWFNRFFDINSGLNEGGIATGIAGGTVTMTAFVYIYSWLLLFLNSSYSITAASNDFWILAVNSIWHTLGWSFFLVILFKHALRTK